MNKNGGISFLGLLQVALIVLKLTNLITWSWWLVLLPILLVGGFGLIVILIIFLLYGFFR